MPKMKSNRAANKRFKIRKSGTIKRSQSGMRHILTSKSSGQKMALRKMANVHPSDAAAIRKLLPYG